MTTKQISKILIISIAFLNIGVVSAQAVNNVAVKEIWVGAYNHAPESGHEATTRIITDHGTFTGLGCARADAFTITSGPLSTTSIVPQNLYYEQQFNLLHASMHAGERVDLWISGCTSDGKFPRAIRVTGK